MPIEHPSPTPEQPLTLSPLEWMQALYGGAVAHGWVEFRLILNGKIEKRWAAWPMFEGHPDAVTLEDVRRWVASGQNVYYGVSLRKERGVSGDAGCLPVRLAWADLDLKDTAGYVPDGQDVKQMTPEALKVCKLAMFAELMSRCAGLSILPAAVVDSGHGLQVIWKRTASSDTAETEALNLMLCEVFSNLGADKKTRNPERILRLPNSQNLKNPARPLPVEVWHLDPEQTVSQAALDALTPEPAPPPAPAPVRLPSKPAASTGNAAKDRAAKRRRAEVAAALQGEAEKVAGMLEGGRNDQLNVSAVKLARFLPFGELEEGELLDALTGAALSAGLEENEVRSTIRSGIAHGTKEPADPERFDAEEEAKEQSRKARKVKPSGKLSVAAHTSASGPDLPSAYQIPEPEGEGGSYSDGQVKELLVLTWPVVDVTSDTAHGHRLRELAGDDLAFVAGLGGYVAWDSQQWLSGGKDGAGQVEAKRRVQGLGVFMKRETERLLSLYAVLNTAAMRASADHGPDSREFKQLRSKADAMEKAYYRHCAAARRTEGDTKQAAILNSAKTLYVKDVHLFEPRPWVVGFQNGTWDKGEFRAAQRGDHMLTLAAVPYEPDTDQGDWLEVLERITGGDSDLALTLQDVAGYALSGASSLRLLPWLYGEGGTGKSTFDALLSTVLGELATTVDPKMLAADAARERLGATIWGKRVATISEAGNSRLDAEALKMLSGGDRLSVRMLYAEAFTARASHVLLMVANDAPRVEAYDDALKDRVLALPFNHRLDGGAPLLGGQRLEELRQDASSDLVRGFAAWAVAGLARVHKTGKVHRAAVCLTTTQAFWNDVDPLHDFWLEQDISELVMGVEAGPLRKRYEGWCQEMGTKALGAKNFGKACKSVGLEQVKSGVVRWKLTNRGKFPDTDLGRMGRMEANSPKPSYSSLYEREVKEFRENGVHSAHSAQIEHTEALAPASGEL